MQEIITVPTPSGKKKHGILDGDTFTRRVSEKDRMRIFDAWSIHPKVLGYLNKNNVKTLRFIHSEGKVYEMSIETANEKGFEKSFAGGATVYLPLRWFTIPGEKKEEEEIPEKKEDPQGKLFDDPPPTQGVRLE